MKYIFRFSGISRYAIWLTVILFTIQVNGQQPAPKITLISPAAGDSLNNSGMILLKAEIISDTPIKTYKIFNDREMKVNESGNKLKKGENNNYLLETNLDLRKGQNIIYFEVRNESSTSTSEKRIIFSQIEPFIKWISPAENNTTVQLKGATLKAEIRTLLPVQNINLMVNGDLLPLDLNTLSPTGNGTYLFEKTVELSRGRNNFSIVCSNARGKSTSDSRTIINAYTSKPVVRIINPEISDSLNTTGLVTVKAEIESRTPLLSYKIFSNEEVKISETGNKLVQKDSITYVIGTFLDVKMGLSELYITALNASGTGTSEKRVIYCQLRPFVKWQMPIEENSSVGSTKITLRAEIKSGAPLKQTVVNVNGIPIIDDKAKVALPENDTYSLEKQVELKPGKNIVYITSVNTKGETRSEIRYINCTVGATPVITLINPTVKDSVSISGLATLNAEIVSRFELQSYRIFINRNVVVSESAATLEKKDSITYIVNSFVPLQVGENMIFLEARNSAGISTSPRRSILCSLGPVIKWVLPSSVTTTFDAGRITIKAEITSGFDLSAILISVNGSSVTVNKDSLKRKNNLTWVLEKPISLGAGSNNIFLTVDNARGSAKSTVRQVNYIPGVKSEIIWIKPTALSSETEEGEFQVSASIKSATQVKTARVIINGTELADGGKSRISTRGSQEYIYENTIPLRPGDNTIKISASTVAETVGSEERIITYNAPVLPGLEWKNPTSDNSLVTRPSVDLKMQINSKAALKIVSVYLNGKAIENINLQNSVRKENDYFILENAIPIGPGENSIYIVASNNAGMIRSDIRTIRYTVPEETKVIANVTETKPEETKVNETKAAEEKKAIETKQAEVKVAEIKVAETAVSDMKAVTVTAPATPPVLTWVSPSLERNDNIIESTVRIKAIISSAAKVQSVLFYVNGVATETVNELSTSGKEADYNLEKQINLNPGENTIYFVATNAAGSKRSDFRYLTMPVTTPPVVSWSFPNDANTISDKQNVTIEACIKSASELKSVQVLLNGAPLSTKRFFDPPVPGNCNYRFTAFVPLREGFDNSIIIYAENFAGTANSDERIVKYAKGLITEKRIALVIGNADYGTSGALSNPENDANLMEGTLRSLNFEVIKKLNATYTEMKESIVEFSDKLAEYNVALFYYAGHGIQVGESHYLIPVDAKLNKPTDCAFYAIEVEMVQKQFEQVPDNTNILILDACRENPFKTWTRGGGASQAFKPLNPVKGTFTFFATAPGSVAADGFDKNGVFTEELVKQMVVPQSILYVAMNTRNAVLKKTNGQQRPQEWNDLTGDFYFKK